MNSFLRNISLIEFKHSKAPALFGAPDTDTMFGIVSNETEAYKFSWKSELVYPVLKAYNGACLLGIDLDFVILNLEKKEVLHQLQFDTFFLDIQFHDDVIYVITELEVFRINTFDFKLIDCYPLPDMFDKMETINHQLVIKCFGGEMILIVNG